MNFSNEDKALLLNNGASVLSNITLYDETGSPEYTFNEDNFLVDWTYEDYRYVPENGFIGQFVERTFDGNLLDIPTGISLDGKEIKPELGIQDIVNSVTNYYPLGTFMITQIGEKDTNGMYAFQSSDYTKKFNILYKDSGKYPCLALELLNSVCSQVKVDYVSDGMCLCYAVTKDGLEAGNYCFKLTDDEDVSTYYNFTLEDDLNFRDCLMLRFKDNKLILKQVVVNDNIYENVRTEISYTETSSSTYTELQAVYIPYYDFTNNDFVIEDNQFDEDELCRDVVKAIAKLSYTWARVNEDDKLCLDFTTKTTSDVDEYNEIDIDLYYENITTGNTVAPVNKVLIGMSQVDGENVYATSESYTEETESAIRIYDNPLTHNELLRKIALNGCERLYGLTYTPLTINTIGHPWLYGDDFVKITNLSEQDLYTYPFDRKIDYKGYLNTTLSSTAENAIRQNYEYSKNVLYKVTKTEIDVDKANNRIDLLTSRVEGDEEDVSTVKIDIGNIEGRVQHIETDELGQINSKLTQVTTTMDSIQNLFQITGGSNLIKNSAFLLDDDVWEFEDLENNLIDPSVYSSTTVNGITYTKNSDGSITANGTATANSFFTLTSTQSYTENASYTLSGCPSGGDYTNTYSLYTDIGTQKEKDIGQGVTFTASGTTGGVFIVIRNGQTVNDLTFIPRLIENTLPHYHTPLGQGYDSSVIGSVVSKSCIQLQNTRMLSDINENNIQIALLNTPHSFSYAYRLDDNTTATIRLKDVVSGVIIYEKELTPTQNITKMQFPERAQEGEEQEQFLPININYVLEVVTESTQEGSLYLYDLMLNSGDVKGWEPSSGEISSTILKMSTYGLQVTSTGSNISTLLSAGGFAIYPINSSGEISGEPITNFDDTGLQTGVAETTKITIRKYVMDELTLDGTEHHVEYFKE